MENKNGGTPQGNLIFAHRMFEDCAAQDVRHLVDLGNHLAAAGLYSLRGEPRALRPALSVIGCLADEGPFPDPVFSNLYDICYGALEEIPEQLRSDGVYLGHALAWGNAGEAIGLVISFLDLFRVVYVVAPHPETDEGGPFAVLRQAEALSVSYVAASKQDVLIRLEKKPAPAEVKLYVAAHRQSSFPADPVYVPLWLGKQEENWEGFLDDKKEPSIAYLNPRINECTGLYYIWKHESPDIAGLVHYRRLFLSEQETEGSRSLIGAEEIRILLSRYDILVYQLEVFSAPLKEQMVSSGILPENSARALSVFRRLIAEKQPGYIDAFDRVMNGYAFYPCNMFIARKEVFDSYCEWLFSFLIDAAKELDFDEYEDANKRTAGFLAERMLTVWLVKQSMKVRELEVTQVAS